MICGRAMKLRDFASVLVVPGRAVSVAESTPSPEAVLCLLIGGAALLRATTLPRQIGELSSQINGVTSDALAAHYAAMRSGLIRLIVFDRLVPPPTLVLSAFLVGLAAGPALSLSRDQDRLLWTAILLGLAPIAIQRIGETVATYLTAAGTLGDAITLPQVFATGPGLFAGADHRWVEQLDASLNLVSLWCLFLWAGVLWVLDGGKWKAWHVGLPLLALVIGGVVTGVLGPAVIRGILIGSGS